MRYFLLIVMLAGTGCTAGPSGRERMSNLISAHIAPQQTCIRLPGDGEWADVRDDQATIGGVTGPAGGSIYPDRMDRREESIRATFGLLAELGLYTLEGEALPGPSPGTMRHYKPSPLGKAHIRLVPGGHGQSGWYGLCYGARRLIAIDKVGPIRVKPCDTSRSVYFTYHYVDIPAWADDPRLRRFFPDIIDSAAARTVRHDGEELGYYEGKWFVRERSDAPYLIPCIG